MSEEQKEVEKEGETSEKINDFYLRRMLQGAAEEEQRSSGWSAKGGGVVAGGRKQEGGVGRASQGRRVKGSVASWRWVGKADRQGCGVGGSG